LGFIRFFGYNENPLIDVILPILVSLVGLTDGVHLMVQIRKLRAAGATREEAAERGLQHVGLGVLSYVADDRHRLWLTDMLADSEVGQAVRNLQHRRGWAERSSLW
jgi:hypothetical protein